MGITTEARIVAAFTFLTAMLLGVWRDVADLVSGLLDTGEEAVVHFIVGAVAAGVTALVRTATTTTKTPWARHVGGAATIIGAVVTLAAVLRIVDAYLPN